MQYPSLPIYIPTPVQQEQRPSATPEYPQSSPAVQYPKLQPMEVAMPFQRPVFNYHYGDVPQIDVLNTILLVVSILLGVWVILLTVCNVSTFFYLLKHPTLFIILIVAYFAIDLLLKMFTVVAGVLAGITAGGVFSVASVLVSCGLSLVGFIVFILWSWSNLSLGTNIALIIEFVLQAVVAVCTALVTKPKPEQFYRYVMVPKPMAQYYP